MSERRPDTTNRYVPSGVDAQSWFGFEQRIQERRFKALLDTINTAVAQRDVVAARAALDEARELRPGAPELTALAARIALLPPPPQAESPSMQFWSRALGAAAMLVVGVGLVIGLEGLRSSEDAVAADVAVPVQPAAAETPAPSPALAVADEPVAPTLVETSADADAPAAVETAAPAVEPPVRETTVGTSARPGAVLASATPGAAPARTSGRPDVVPPVVLPSVDPPVTTRRTEIEPVVPVTREIPDDYVASAPRREERPIVESAPSSPVLAASVMPQPISITAPPPVAPSPVPPPAAAAVVAPSRGDTSRVAQVLNQYARAYGELDPNAARAVWPTVDERALSRAFASLASQDVSFDKCDIDVKGSVASASCRGTASYVGKIGSRQARTEARQWIFELKLHGDDWKIEKAEARQLAAR